MTTVKLLEAKRIILLLSVVFLLCFSGCGYKDNKAEVIAQLEEKLVFSKTHDYKIIDITNCLFEDHGKKEGVLYARVIAEDDFVYFEKDYAINCEKKGNKWTFISAEEINPSGNVLKIQSVPSDELKNNSIVYGDKFIEVKSNGNRMHYYYSREYFTELCKKTYTYDYIFEFDLDTYKWRYADLQRVDENVEWNIDGTWEIVKQGTAMGGTAVANDHYKIRANIEVKDSIAYIDIYAYGTVPKYLTSGSGSYTIDLSVEQSSYSTPAEYFDYDLPGYSTISVYTYLWFDEEGVHLNNMYPFTRISENTDCGDSFLTASPDHTYNCYDRYMDDVISFKYQFDQATYLWTGSFSPFSDSIYVKTKFYVKNRITGVTATRDDMEVHVYLYEFDDSGEWVEVAGYYAYVDAIEGGLDFDVSSSKRYKLKIELCSDPGDRLYVVGHGHVERAMY